MSTDTRSQAVMVSQRAWESENPYDLIKSNISVVNALLHEYLTHAEIPLDSMRSYYVDYYLAQVNNGGFSQFVYNSRWDSWVISLIREGLEAMGARRHLALFEEGVRLVEGLGAEELARYFASELFGKNATRDRLNAINDRFFELSKEEDLIALNSAWLRGRPGLLVLTVPEMEQEVARRAAAVSDREQRIAEARQREPRYMKLARALAAEAGHTFSHVTMGDPSHVHQRRQTVAWHFVTDQGHHYMVEADGQALMYQADANALVASLPAPNG